ncbi:MAG TPA: VWA domain-containing protein [Rhodothermales bacterium]|nr:VWA domain-containing protein [Rhodothermales bacterium]
MTRSNILSLLAAAAALTFCLETSAQSLETSRPLVNIGPFGEECRVETCVVATGERAGICAVQILDNSGSMNTNARFEAAQSGITHFVDSLRAEKGDRIGIVTYSGPSLQFGSMPRANPGPVAVTVQGEPLSESFPDVKGTVLGLGTASVSALTPLAAAIEAGSAVLDECPAGLLRTIIVSTDGLPNWDDDVQCTVTPLTPTACTEAAVGAAEAAKAGGIHIITIGIDLDPADPSNAFGISLLQEIATSPEDANFFNTAAGLSQSDIYSHLSRTVASPGEVTFFEPLPDSCWGYVAGSTTGTTTEDPILGLLGTRETLSWNVGGVSDGQPTELCYSMAFDAACGEPPSSLVVQSGGEVLWTLMGGRRESQPLASQEFEGIQQCTIVFPVELVDFRATSSKNVVTLAWRTASETDNAGFGVERSTTIAGAFEEVGFVGGSGTSQSFREYRFSDVGLPPGSHRYRLRQVDYDGTFEFSRTVAVSVELPSSHFMSPVHPNPARGSARFELSVARSQTVRIDLLDTTGRIIRTVADGPIGSGTAKSISLDVDDIPGGMYVVRVLGEYFSVTSLVAIVQ